MLHFYETTRTGKPTRTQSRALVARTVEREQEMTANGYRVSFQGDRNALELAVIAAKSREKILNSTLYKCEVYGIRIIL